MSILKKKQSSVKQKSLMLEKRATKFLKNRAKSLDDNGDEIEDEDEEEYTSSFKERLAGLDQEGMNPEQRDAAVLKLMRNLVLDLLPIAEKNYRKYPIHTNASAVNSLISQEREISNDLRAISDYRARANLVVDLVKQEYEQITSELISNIQACESRIRKSNNIKEELQQLLQDQGSSLIRSRETVGQRVLQMMIGSDSNGKKSR